MSSEVVWVETWKRAAAALASQKRTELAQLTEEKALRASDALLSLAPLSSIAPSRLLTSGLVEQQALFHRRPVK